MNKTTDHISNFNDINDFNQRLAKAGGSVIVDFMGTYCGPCKLLAPLLEELSEQYKDIEVWTLDIEKQQDIAQHFGIRSVPTLLAFKDGMVTAQQVGFSGPGKVRKMFEELVAS